MIFLSFFLLGLLSRASIFIHTKRIIVGLEAHNDSCTDCIKLTSLLEGIESSYQINENVTLELLDLEYQIGAEEIEQYLKNFSEHSLMFTNPVGKISKIIFLTGRPSKIYFQEEFFSLNLINLLQLQIENIHFVFFGQNKPLQDCLFC